MSLKITDDLFNLSCALPGLNEHGFPLRNLVIQRFDRFIFILDLYLLISDVSFHFSNLILLLSDLFGEVLGRWASTVLLGLAVAYVSSQSVVFRLDLVYLDLKVFILRKWLGAIISDSS